MSNVKRSPEREALAEAIRVRDEAVDRARQAEAACAGIKKGYNEAVGRWSAASDALNEAKREMHEALRMHGGDEAAIVAQAIKCERPLPRDAIAAAEREYAQALEAKDLGKQGLNRAEGTVTASLAAATGAAEGVRKAMELVCQTHLPDLLDAAEKARDDYVTKRAIVALVSGELDGVRSNWAINREPFPARIRSFLHGADLARTHGTEAWDEARKALCRDADAPLPG